MNILYGLLELTLAIFTLWVGFWIIMGLLSWSWSIDANE